LGDKFDEEKFEKKWEEGQKKRQEHMSNQQLAQSMENGEGSDSGSNSDDDSKGLFEKIDKNGDQEVTKAEAKAAMEEKVAKHVERHPDHADEIRAAAKGFLDCIWEGVDGPLDKDAFKALKPKAEQCGEEYFGKRPKKGPKGPQPAEE
jgi:hypothetical protein